MSEEPLTFLGAARRVLTSAAEPLHYAEITRRALDGGWLENSGKAPDATMGAQLAVHVKNRGDEGDFVRVKPSIQGLRLWVEEGRIEPMDQLDEGEGRTYVPHFPIYAETRAVLPDWFGALGNHSRRR